MKVIEVVFYIHGVSPDTRPESHAGDYSCMHTGIMEALGDKSLWPNEYGGAEWGWNHDGGSSHGHKTLADAQRRFGAQIDESRAKSKDRTLNPLRLAFNNVRPLLFHGFGDMFYYVSAQGKWSVRYSIAKQLKEHIFKRLDPNEDIGVSLTLLGHSAGGVVAFDLLYYLFNDVSSDDVSSWAKDNQVDPNNISPAEAKKAENDLRLLKELVKNKKLRLRQLITFGTPISMLMFRNDSLVQCLAEKKTLNPEEYGFKSEFVCEKLKSGNPRWLNIWENDDLISWPVEPIMHSNLVKDVAIDMADWSFNTHSMYWVSQKCYKEIARYWE